MEHERIYADFNGMQDSVCSEGFLSLYLHFWGSLVDLSRAQLKLEEGIKLNVYSDSDENEDLEVTGTVRFDRTAGQWFVEFENKDIRYVSRMVGQENEVKFPCWSCQKDLDAYITVSYTHLTLPTILLV